jgi:hypothetical protein
MVLKSTPNVLATVIHNAHLELICSASKTPFLSDTTKCDRVMKSTAL